MICPVSARSLSQLPKEERPVAAEMFPLYLVSCWLRSARSPSDPVSCLPALQEFLDILKHLKWQMLTQLTSVLTIFLLAR